jgi:hypothetical protein
VRSTGSAPPVVRSGPAVGEPGGRDGGTGPGGRATGRAAVPDTATRARAGPGAEGAPNADGSSHDRSGVRCAVVLNGLGGTKYEELFDHYIPDSDPPRRDPDRAVEYGQTGRVKLTTLTKETFIPRFLERDQAIRRPPCEPYPWDGAGNVQPFQQLGVSVVEGVY